jgi:uncharacterized protein YhhL (DUF1145 family)
MVLIPSFIILFSAVTFGFVNLQDQKYELLSSFGYANYLITFAFILAIVTLFINLPKPADIIVKFVTSTLVLGAGLKLAWAIGKIESMNVDLVPVISPFKFLSLRRK